MLAPEISPEVLWSSVVDFIMVFVVFMEGGGGSEEEEDFVLFWAVFEDWIGDFEFWDFGDFESFCVGVLVSEELLLLFFFFETWELIFSAWEEPLIDTISTEPVVEPTLDEVRCRFLAGIICKFDLRL